MNAFTQRALSQIDLDKVQAAVREHELLEYEYDEVADYLLRACDKWLEADVHGYKKAFTEIKSKELYAGCVEVSQVYDLVLIKDDGIGKIVDWKTGSISRPNYEQDLIYSDQTEIYLGIANELHNSYVLEELEYRCLDRDKIKTVKAIWRDPTPRSADIQLFSTRAMYHSLKELNVWPRNRASCFKGGNECPWYKNCNNMTMPEGFDNTSYQQESPHSKSGIRSFLACPERYRREVIRKDQGRAEGVVLFGNAFHAGASSIWKQVFEIREGLLS